jgi:hypothetical protein
MKEDIYEEPCQPLEEEQDFSHDSTESSKDITRDVNYEDEAPVTTLQSDEALQDPIPPTQDEENEVSHFPFQFFDDTLFYDSESEEEVEPLDEMDPLYLKTENVEANLPLAEVIQILEAPTQEGLSKVSYFPFQIFNDSLSYDAERREVLDALNPPCYDTNTDIVDIDKFIHVGRRRWDVVGSDIDPIYDTENNSQLFPSQLSQHITFDFEQWQQGDDIFIDAPQIPKDDLAPYPPDIFWSYLEDFDEYSSEHLDLSYEDNYLPPPCSGLARSKSVVCPKEDSHDLFLQPPLITLPCRIIKGAVGRYIFCIESPLKQTLESKGWLKTISSSLSSQCFNFPLRIFQPPTRSLLVPLECEDVLGNQFAELSSQYSGPSTFHDPFLKWIEYFSFKLTWHGSFPPTRLHELYFVISDDMIYILTHDIFVLDLSLFWSMMKHKGRCHGTLLDWLHWLFDYTQHPANR